MNKYNESNIPLIAIVGQPNVGKSTIFNRLSARWNSIVEGRPGITRDRIIAEMDLDGITCHLMDTGGLQINPKEKIEKKMSQQALRGIEEADLIIFVFDGRQGVTSMDHEWVTRFRKVKTPKIFVVNKLDEVNLDEKARDFFELGVSPIIAISAENQRNFSGLYEEITKAISGSQGERKDEGTKGREDEEEGEREDDRNLSVAIIGRPNVGKSTLLNTLLDEERCIVDDVPGTTRDPIDSIIEYNNIIYNFVDTAGIRKRAKTRERVEIFSVMAALKCIDRANLVLLLVDAITGPTEQDAHVAGYAFEKEKAIIILANKWDEGQKTFTREEFEEKMELKMNYLNFCPILYISAKTGKNVNKIFQAIESVRKQYEFKVTTGELNRVFEKIINHHSLPLYKGQEIKMYYATQVNSSPPSFIVFCNYPKEVHFSYKRYLVNSLREIFSLNNVPVRLFFRKR